MEATLTEDCAITYTKSSSNNNMQLSLREYFVEVKQRGIRMKSIFSFNFDGDD
jgi:hypothetical protein